MSIFKETLIYEEPTIRIAMPSFLSTLPTYFIACIFFNIILLITAWYQVGNLLADKPETWFQRIGSIITIISLIVELNMIQKLEKIKFSSLHKNNHYMKNNALKDITPDALQTKLENYFIGLNHFVTKLSILFIAIGTIVWGYGDLLFVLLN